MTAPRLFAIACVFDERVGYLVAARRRDGDRRTGERGGLHETHCDVVAVAEIRDLLACERAAVFGNRHEIRDALAGMVAVGERVDDRDR
jgi:hypothetical protein